MKKFFTKRKVALALAVVMMVGITSSVSAANSSPAFTDVPASHWAYASIERMADEGVMNGVGGGRFNPTGTVTNGEFFTMLVRAFYPQQLAAAQQTYSSGEWWLPAAEVAYSLDLVLNTDFGSLHYLLGVWTGTAEITREDMAQAVYRVPINAGQTVAAEQLAATQAKIGDWEDVDEWNKDAVATAYALGLIQGDNLDNFRPQDFMTRAEAAVVMDRLLASGIEVEQGDVELPTPTPTPTPEPSGNTVGAITPASQVNSVKPNVGKSDAYPTKGGGYYFANDERFIAGGESGVTDYDGILAKAQQLSNNGYRTGANVDIGNASLVYELLDLVNEMRVEGGKKPVLWCPSDSIEEFTLLRAHDLTISYSHERPVDNDPLTSRGEAIASGYSRPIDAFNGWKNSPGHYKSLMRDDNIYMCAARCGNFWVITLWERDLQLATVERFAVDNYVKVP